mgnify:CR=1 FL=1
MATEVEIKKPISYEILNEEDKVQFTFETVEGENLVKNPGFEQGAEKPSEYGKLLLSETELTRKVGEYLNIVEVDQDGKVVAQTAVKVERPDLFELIKYANSQKEDAAYDVLLSRVHLLGFVGNTTDLKTAVAAARGVSTEGKTEESVAVLNAAITKAEKMIEEANTLQEDLDAMIIELQEAIFNLRKIPNKDELQNLVNSVKAMNLGAYTPETASAVKAAYAKAVAVLNDDNATEDKVKEAVAELSTAVNKLAAKSAAKTADTMPVATSMILLAVSAFGILLVMKKRKEMK